MDIPTLKPKLSAFALPTWTGRNIAKLALGGLVAFVLFIELYPIVWLLLSSIKTPPEFTVKPIYALPEGFYWKNYADAWTAGKMSTYFQNSLLATLPALTLLLALGVPAAFAIQIMKWKWNNRVLLLFLAGIMVPVQIVLLPLFTMYFHLHLLDNRLGLILTYTVFGLPLTIFLMTGYFKTIPHEVLEAAVMDGASIYRVFLQIALPMVSGAIVTILLVQFFFIWNDLVFSLTFISDTDLRTLQTGLLNFEGQYGQRQWGPTFASIAMAVIPTLLLYLALNRLVMKGLTAGAVKG